MGSVPDVGVVGELVHVLALGENMGLPIAHSPHVAVPVATPLGLLSVERQGGWLLGLDRAQLWLLEQLIEAQLGGVGLADLRMAIGVHMRLCDMVGWLDVISELVIIWFAGSHIFLCTGSVALAAVCLVGLVGLLHLSLLPQTTHLMVIIEQIKAFLLHGAGFRKLLRKAND